ncbi:RluA family pseudouridine synthase [Bacillus sp. FJAT-49711]|uniref:RluA family pseudouridine synthase n=1 Tax=Bacillus sp. FJAT-49711 TaxID=2833585 RepID=UPI001BCA561E|nr:RluA family pseudouridine synthase [Bacillus sp. FJAT-49711]MBS4218161.1 RluA family pseudouridine synthase [Bacillus sp. FJAT-49711]
MNSTRMKIIIQDEWTSMNIEELFRNIWEFPKKVMHELRMDKAVSVNGQVINWNTPLKHKDEIIINLRESHDVDTPSPHPLEILYEDDYLLAVNKPAGMATHPNENEKNSLVNAVAYYLQSTEQIHKARHIHRLDKNTTGVVLFAKNALSKVVLDKMLNDRKIKRTYWALADGIIKRRKGDITAPIGRDRHHPTRRRVSKTGQQAITHYNVLETFLKENLSLIECSLDTGRTHQIRVHLSYIGHPLSGDKLYGGSAHFQRQALHARKLEFTHPFTLDNIQVIAPFLDNPPIFEQFL